MAPARLGALSIAENGEVEFAQAVRSATVLISVILPSVIVKASTRDSCLRHPCLAFLREIRNAIANRAASPQHRLKSTGTNQFWEWAIGQTSGGGRPVGEHFMALDVESWGKTVRLPVGRES